MNRPPYTAQQELKAAKRVFGSLLGHIRDSDLTAILDSHQAIAHSNAFLGISAQAEANRVHQENIDTAFANLPNYYLDDMLPKYLNGE